MVSITIGSFVPVRVSACLLLLMRLGLGYTNMVSPTNKASDPRVLNFSRALTPGEHSLLIQGLFRLKWEANTKAITAKTASDREKWHGRALSIEALIKLLDGAVLSARR